MNPDDWKATTPGMGACFHQALHRWALLRQDGHSAKIAIGVVEVNDHSENRHLHAWLSTDDPKYVVSAVTGEMRPRETFYRGVGIDRRTVVLVNPRSIMRARKGVIDRETVHALLNATGIAWRMNERGGVLPK